MKYLPPNELDDKTKKMLIKIFKIKGRNEKKYFPESIDNIISYLKENFPLDKINKEDLTLIDIDNLKNLGVDINNLSIPELALFRLKFNVNSFEISNRYENSAFFTTDGKKIYIQKDLFNYFPFYVQMLSGFNINVRFEENFIKATIKDTFVHELVHAISFNGEYIGFENLEQKRKFNIRDSKIFNETVTTDLAVSILKLDNFFEINQLSFQNKIDGNKTEEYFLRTNEHTITTYFQGVIRFFNCIYGRNDLIKQYLINTNSFNKNKKLELQELLDYVKERLEYIGKEDNNKKERSFFIEILNLQAELLEFYKTNKLEDYKEQILNNNQPNLIKLKKVMEDLKTFSNYLGYMFEAKTDKEFIAKTNFHKRRKDLCLFNTENKTIEGHIKSGLINNTENVKLFLEIKADIDKMIKQNWETIFKLKEFKELLPKYIKNQKIIRINKSNLIKTSFRHINLSRGSGERII